jgi:N-formylglutamate amidohydrolase
MQNQTYEMRSSGPVQGSVPVQMQLPSPGLHLTQKCLEPDRTELRQVYQTRCWLHQVVLLLGTHPIVQ